MKKTFCALVAVVSLLATAPQAQDTLTHAERLAYVMTFLKAKPYGITGEEVETPFGPMNMQDTRWPFVIDKREWLNFTYRDDRCHLIVLTVMEGISDNSDAADLDYFDQGCNGTVSNTLISAHGKRGLTRDFKDDGNSQSLYERHLKQLSLAVAAFKMLTNQVTETDLEVANAYISRTAGQILSENLTLTQALPRNDKGTRALEIELGPYAWVWLADVDPPEDAQDTVFCSSSVWAPEFLKTGPGSSEGYNLQLYLADCQGSQLAFHRVHHKSGKPAGREKIDDKRHRLLVVYASNILLHLRSEILQADHPAKG